LVEGAPQRVSLRGRQLLGVVRPHVVQQLHQPGEGEAHLRLHARDARQRAVGRPFHDVVEQRGLADAGLAAKHERGAVAGAR
jgi:hypothetical protein